MSQPTTEQTRAAAAILREQFTPEQIAALDSFCMTHTYSEGMRALLGRPSKAELRAARADRAAARTGNSPVTVTTEEVTAAPEAA